MAVASAEHGHAGVRPVRFVFRVSLEPLQRVGPETRVGIRRHGLKYFKYALIPPAPWYVLPILIPIELISTFLVRPFTLAVRLFANMFAGHVILLVFTLGGFVLPNAESLFIKPISLLSWALAVALTFLEALVALLQAYIFVVLTASYVQGALAEEH